MAEVKLSEFKFTRPPFHQVPLFEDKSVCVEFAVYELGEHLKKRMTERGATIRDFAEHNAKIKEMVFKITDHETIVCKDINLTPQTLALIQCWRLNIDQLAAALTECSVKEKAYMDLFPPISAWCNMLQGKKCHAPTLNAFVGALADIAKKQFKGKEMSAYVPEYFMHTSPHLGTGQACFMVQVVEGKSRSRRLVYVDIATVEREGLIKALESAFNVNRYRLTYHVELLGSVYTHYGSQALISSIKEGQIYLAELRTQLTSTRDYILHSKQADYRQVFQVRDAILRDKALVREVLAEMLDSLSQQYSERSFYLLIGSERVPFDPETMSDKQIDNIMLLRSKNRSIEYALHWNELEFTLIPPSGDSRINLKVPYNVDTSKVLSNVESEILRQLNKDPLENQVMLFEIGKADGKPIAGEDVLDRRSYQLNYAIKRKVAPDMVEFVLTVSDDSRIEGKPNVLNITLAYSPDTQSLLRRLCGRIRAKRGVGSYLEGLRVNNDIFAVINDGRKIPLDGKPEIMQKVTIPWMGTKIHKGRECDFTISVVRP